ncbi:DNA polymerase alpha/epsilon subunit B-domain-containing protein [Cyathus striatus]|nr:DNA polymerase alpha/epsilon subunit B-domain-containing protein [Cyathus striatus]
MLSLVTTRSYSSDEKLVAECVSMCQMFNLKPEDLKWKLEALNFRPSATRSELTPITLDSISTLKKKLQRDLAKDNAKKLQVRQRNSENAVVNRSRLPSSMGRNTNAGVAISVPKVSGAVKIENGESVIAHLSSVLFRGPELDLASRKNRAYRYMYEKISERSEALDQVIDDLGDLIRGHYDISELGDPSSSTDLSEGAVMIESSRLTSSGARIPLRFDPVLKIRGNAKGAGGISIFPGAIVALRGKNGGGGYFVATEILALPPLKASPAASGIEDPKLDPSTASLPFSVCVACGPYTPDANLSYKPWRYFLQNIKTSKPEVVILLGPFIDSTHPKIKTGDVDSAPAQLFKAHILAPLCSFLDSSPNSIAVIVPSIRDLMSHHAVFPQSEFDGSIFNNDPRIRLLPNPGRFSINDISFAATSVDVLFHLRKEEFIKRGIEVEPSNDETGSDVMAGLSRHLLQQRRCSAFVLGLNCYLLEHSFYPLFPTPQDLASEVNLDVSHLEGARLTDDAGVDYAPDVLILPSRLKHFAKVMLAKHYGYHFFKTQR